MTSPLKQFPLYIFGKDNACSSLQSSSNNVKEIPSSPHCQLEISLKLPQSIFQERHSHPHHNYSYMSVLCSRQAHGHASMARLLEILITLRVWNSSTIREGWGEALFAIRGVQRNPLSKTEVFVSCYVYYGYRPISAYNLGGVTRTRSLANFHYLVWLLSSW